MIIAFRPLVPLLVLAALLALPALAATEPAQSEDQLPLAVVNDDPVTVRDVVTLFNKRHAGHARFLGGEVEARRFLNVVIDDRLLVQEAYDLGIDELPEVRKYVDDFANAEISKYFVAKQIAESVRVSPEEVKAAWESSISTYVHARHIVLGTRAEADEVRTALVAGADFETLARSCSLSESRRRGGNVMTGWGQFDPEWERVVFALPEGEISPVIEVDGLFEIVQVSQRIEVQRPELEDVAQKIEDALFQREMSARKKEIAAALWSKYGVEVLLQDATPALLLRLLASAPETVVARWEGGQLRRRAVFETSELEPLVDADVMKARKAIRDELQQTINAPLVVREAKALRMDEVPDVAQEIARYRDYVVESVLFRDHIFRDLAVSDAEVQAYYDAHPAELELPEQRRIAQIMVATEADARKVQKEASAPGADFAELAKARSRDMVSAASGGDLGWITADKVPQPFAEVLAAKEGAITKPVKSSTGWHVFKVIAIQPKSLPALADVREKARALTLEAKRRDARAFWVDKLRAASEIRIDDAAIASFVKAHQSAGPPPQHGMQ
jgi:parvulin-like peptidyl-prolyl isomerase